MSSGAVWANLGFSTCTFADDAGILAGRWAYGCREERVTRLGNFDLNLCISNLSTTGSLGVCAKQGCMMAGYWTGFDAAGFC